MRYKYEYLEDEKFLLLIDNQQLTEQYAKITVLDWDEYPIQEIQGVVTAGNLNLDGKSSMRRTCNISVFVADEEYSKVTNVNNLFSLNKKMTLEIGIKNTTKYYTDFPILWFPQGTFVFTNPSLSHSAGGTTISLTCKDKMCLLNGEVGGTFPASVTFHEYETADENGNLYIARPTIVQIIQELVNHFGGEAIPRILVSDLDTRVKRVMKWNGTTPLYLYEEANAAYLTTNEAEAARPQYFNILYWRRYWLYLY